MSLQGKMFVGNDVHEACPISGLSFREICKMLNFFFSTTDDGPFDGRSPDGSILDSWVIH
jgi:hypothetical protein